MGFLILFFVLAWVIGLALKALFGGFYFTGTDRKRRQDQADRQAALTEQLIRATRGEPEPEQPPEPPAPIGFAILLGIFFACFAWILLTGCGADLSDRLVEPTERPLDGVWSARCFELDPGEFSIDVFEFSGPDFTLRRSFYGDDRRCKNAIKTTVERGYFTLAEPELDLTTGTGTVKQLINIFDGYFLLGHPRADKKRPATVNRTLHFFKQYNQ